MKVVINACYGGFGLSLEGMLEYGRLKGLTLYPEKLDFGLYIYWTVPKEARPTPLDPCPATQKQRLAYNKAYAKVTIHTREVPRDDPTLVQLVETLGEAADGRFAKLKIVEIPDGISWQIGEYDGAEWVEETHQTWS